MSTEAMLPSWSRVHLEYLIWLDLMYDIVLVSRKH